MAGMSTALTEFSTTGNSKTSTYTGHTALKPKLVIEKRRVPVGDQQVLEYSAKVVAATVDSENAVLPQKISFEVVVRYPALGASADVTAALAIIRDIVQSDDFTNSVNTQGWL